MLFHLANARDTERVVLSPCGDDEIVVVQIVLGSLEHLPTPHGLRFEVDACGEWKGSRQKLGCRDLCRELWIRAA